MKLVYKEVRAPALRAAQKRYFRGLRTRRDKSVPRGHSVVAPAVLDLYSNSNHLEMCRFISRLKQAFYTGDHVFISFRNTLRITAAAGLLLLAETDSLLKRYRNAKVSCSFPPSGHVGKYRNANYVVESVLKQIGFLGLIGKAERRTPGYAHVDCWEPLTGYTADGSLAGKLLKKIEAKGTISSKARSRLYRGAFEAIANCVDHAYPSLTGGSLFQENRWWMFVGMFENDLAILVCDLGVGIPATLPYKHSTSVIDLVFEMLGASTRSDGDLIRAATYIKRTRTDLEHRGKGGSDLRSLLEHYPEGMLSIYSRRGSFKAYGSLSRVGSRRNRKKLSDRDVQFDLTDNHRKPVCGTIIEWSLPIEALEK